MNDRTLPFTCHEDLATRATDLVTRLLTRDDPVLAGALQPIARAAWGLVADDTGMIELHRAAVDAQRALRLTFHPPRIDEFLAAVIAYAEGDSLVPIDWDDEDEDDENPFLAICPAIGMDETLRFAELSGMYLRVAAALSEISVICRAAAATWTAADEVNRTAAALEVVADRYESAAAVVDDIVLVLAMSNNTGVGPLREHLDELIHWPVVLRERAEWIASLEPGGPTSDAPQDHPADGLREEARRADHWIDPMIYWADGAREVGVQIAPFGDG